MRVLRYEQLKHKVPLSKPHIDRMEADGKFPKRIQLGPKSVAWIEDEVDEWLRQLVAAQRGGKAD
jgi:prophage regulatory protein